LLIIPVSLRFDYIDGEARLSAHYFFLRFRIFPIPVKIEGEKKKKMTKKQKRKAVKEEKKKKLSHYIQTARLAMDMLKASRRGLRLIRESIVVSRLKILASIGGEDAHQAAESYGKTAAALFPALAFLGSIVTVKDPAVYLAPNFLSGETVVEVSARVRIMPLAVLAAAGLVAIRVFKVFYKGNEHTANPAQEHQSKNRAKSA